MEFLTKNLFNTTTMATVASGTLTVDYLLLRDTNRQYVTTAYNDDLLTASLTIDFGSTQSVSKIALLGMNLKSFTIFHSGATANTLALTSTGATTTSDWSTNSETAMYLQFSTIQAQSFTIDMKTTQVANSEKAIGYLYLGDLLLDFERIPSSSNYKPRYKSEEIKHKLSDGGMRIQKVATRFSTEIKLKYVSRSFADSLYNVWSDGDEFVFVPFGTTTAWDEIFHTVVWGGEFDFIEYADNAVGAGFSGSISLFEVS